MNTPLPQDVATECRKCAKVGRGEMCWRVERVGAQAKGIAILSVIKAGFLFSGRGGAGLVVARLDDGSWSAPSAIGTVGFGAGGQIGAELTDFVIILNTPESVKAFSLGGNVTLGGNLSVAAGPIGRNAEAAGTVGKMSAVYSYSKTRGLFAGISIEGSVLMERKETNATFYRRKVSAKEILSGAVPPPPAAEDLYRALNRRSTVDDDDEAAGEGHYGSRDALASGSSSSSRGGWPDNRRTSAPVKSESNGHFDRPATGPSSRLSHVPTRPPPPPPSALAAARRGSAEKAVALYDFAGDRDGDLSFRKGDLIVILKKDPSEWWTGRCNGSEGVFPANYVQVS
ncbi:hypothetical protein HK101_006246 [Irineochytrium annulatum]|nr:hypothetical protein HK101_006246 [Irineochytrium annulatum]